MSLRILSKSFKPWAYLISGVPKNFLIGNVGDAMLHTVEFGASVRKDYTQSSQLIVSQTTNAAGSVLTSLINSDATTWNAEGFAEGDFVVIKYDVITSGVSVTNTATGTVQSAIDDEMLVDFTAGTPPSNGITPSKTSDTVSTDNVYIFTYKAPDQILLQYFNVENSNATSNGSFIDGSAPTLLFDNVPTTINATATGEFIGDQSGAALFGSVISQNIKPVIKSLGVQNAEYFYEVTFSSFIPFMASQSEFASGTAPAEFLSNACLTDRIIIEARPEKNNPNVTMRTDNEIKTQGNTGWFNENYNGNLTAKTSVISYVDYATGTPLTALNSVGETEVTITISGLSAYNGQFAAGVALVPADVSDISNNTNPFHANTKLNYMHLGPQGGGINTSFRAGYGGANNIQIRMAHVRQVGTDIIIKFNVLPTSGLITEFQAAAVEDLKYIVYAVADSGVLDAADSDRETLLCDYNTFTEYSASAGSWGHTVNILSRTQATTETQNDCALDLKLEDTLMLKTDFLVGSTVPTLLNFQIVAQNSSTGQQYDLDKISIDLSQFPTVGGVPQFNYTALRGFKTAESKLNTVSVSRNAAGDTGGQYAYIGLYPIKIRWEDWISRLNVPSDFYDTSALNNGLNNNWLHYLNTAGWDIKFVIDTYVGTTRYEDSITIGFNDYDDNATISPTFAYYRDSDNTLLNGGTDTVTGTPLGVILEEDVRVEIIFTRSFGTWVPGDVNNLFAVNRIEIDGGAGFLSQHEISTETAPLSDSPLQPIATETDLKLEYVSGTELKTTCLIKPALLERATRYKITARLGCK